MPDQYYWMNMHAESCSHEVAAYRKAEKWRLVARCLLIGFHYCGSTINGPYFSYNPPEEFYARAARSENGCINALHGLRG